MRAVWIAFFIIAAAWFGATVGAVYEQGRREAECRKGGGVPVNQGRDCIIVPPRRGEHP